MQMHYYKNTTLYGEIQFSNKSFKIVNLFEKHYIVTIAQIFIKCYNPISTLRTYFT